MSKHAPGSVPWWQETVLIVAGGLALALLLWDGPLFGTGGAPVTTAAPARAAPLTLADLLDAGCLTQDHLRDLVAGEEIAVSCVVDTADGPPERRLFP